MSKFEQNNNREIELQENFDKLKQHLQIDVHDLYFQNLLSQEDILVLLKTITKVKEIDELREVEKEFYDSDAFFVYQEGRMADEFVEIKNFKTFFDKIIDNIKVSNWEEGFVLLLEKLSQSYIQDYHEILIKSWLAQFLEQVYQCYMKENVNIQIFEDQLKTVLTEFEPKLPILLKTEKGAELGKRKPSFIESVDGTMERFHKIRELEDILKDLADCVIVGGSMSYGPFFNIRKSLDETGGSDIDLIVIVKEDRLDSFLWEKLQRSHIFKDEEKTTFFERMNKFQDLFKRGEADVFSQKFHVQGTDFEMSIHFFTPAVFDKMVGKNLEDDLSANRDTISVLTDYKAKKFPYKVCAQQNFLGGQYEYEVPPQRQVDGGVITKLPVYIIHEQKFYPGIYQNLISPCFTVSYDPTGETTGKVQSFRDTMEKRLGKEADTQPEAKLLKSHIRHKIFPPELFKR